MPIIVDSLHRPINPSHGKTQRNKIPKGLTVNVRRRLPDDALPKLCPGRQVSKAQQVRICPSSRKKCRRPIRSASKTRVPKLRRADAALQGVVRSVRLGARLKARSLKTGRLKTGGLISRLSKLPRLSGNLDVDVWYATQTRCLSSCRSKTLLLRLKVLRRCRSTIAVLSRSCDRSQPQGWNLKSRLPERCLILRWNLSDRRCGATGSRIRIRSGCSRLRC